MHVAVLPHHNLTTKALDAWYRAHAEQYIYDMIIIVSPDHFSRLQQPIESTPK